MNESGYCNCGESIAFGHSFCDDCAGISAPSTFYRCNGDKDCKDLVTEAGEICEECEEWLELLEDEKRTEVQVEGAY
jgi:hypothetical protein